MTNNPARLGSFSADYERQNCNMWHYNTPGDIFIHTYACRQTITHTNQSYIVISKYLQIIKCPNPMIDGSDLNKAVSI